jgi:ABC-type dipeptide/oligopeptide/nickel transport system permease component
MARLMDPDLVSFVIKRLLAMIVVLYIVVTIVFILAHASPYDPIRLVLGRKYNSVNSAVLRRQFGLDLPVWQQYLNYLGGLLHGNLGYSEESETLGQPVWQVLQNGVFVTLKLGGMALALSLIVGLPVGLMSALRQNSVIDHGSQAVMVTLYAIPTFVLVPVCQLIFGDFLRWFPVSGWGDPGVLGFKEMVLPVTLYAASISAFFAKSFRSFMLEILRQDYIRTARAKGLKQRTIVYTHAVKNTLLPLASIVGPTIAFLIVGSFIIEFFFAIPGVGFITVNSVEQSDFPVIEATTVLLAAFVVVVNMLTDIFYSFVDPRVRL